MVTVNPQETNTIFSVTLQRTEDEGGANPSVGTVKLEKTGSGGWKFTAQDGQVWYTKHDVDEFWERFFEDARTVA